MSIRFLVPLVGSLLLASCSEPARMEGFDSDSWKSDKAGCASVRQGMQVDFEQVRRKLYGKEEPEIIDILGKPDGEQLMARGQRIFYYYLESGSQCEQKNNLSEANRAEVRFNALNRVSEITYLRPLSN
ncbi:hypothetical protein [Pontibacter beigongshangensis]|uniref:hypothetical protein n=1 Tax=Pontibacter beigongshangensis TaxID=2574733 RepID=UPI0016508417|nr:hypothetical protein [Pontibacter beigongshangensis]